MAQGKGGFKTGRMINYLGAVCAFAIGSGFASGQELMQYYTAYGWQMFLVGGLFIGIFIYTNYRCSAESMAFGMTDSSKIFKLYCGNALGKFYSWFCGFFCFLSFIVMLAGAGSTLNQQYGLPIAVGAVIMCAIVVLVTIAGLNGIVEVIGKVGPVIIVLVLFIAIFTCITHASGIEPGIAAIEAGQYDGIISKVGNNWAMSGLSYAGFVLLWFAGFMANLGSSTNETGEYRELLVGQILGALIYIAACWICAIALASEIDLTAGAAIPNLILATQVWPPLAAIFAIVIYAAIFSTACPLLYTASTTVAEEGTGRYKAVTIVAALVALVIAIFVPYQGLVNVVYGYCGYVGAAFFVIIIIHEIRFYTKASRYYSEAMVEEYKEKEAEDALKEARKAAEKAEKAAAKAREAADKMTAGSAKKAHAQAAAEAREAAAKAKAAADDLARIAPAADGDGTGGEEPSGEAASPDGAGRG